MAHDARIVIPWSAKEIAEAGFRKGMRKEDRFIYAWRPLWRNRRHYQQWLLEVYLSDFDDDIAGIDAYLNTKIPNHQLIPIQIKSSEWGIQKANRMYPKIPVLAVRDWDNSVEIRRNTIYAVLQKYPHLAYVWRKMGCTVSPYTLSALNLS